MTNRRQFCMGLAASPLLATAAGSAFAQERRQLTMVVPYPPGGSADILGRLFSNALSTELNEKIIVENRAGAGGTLGASYVAGMPADGRTMLYTLGNLLLNQEFLLKEVRFRPMESLAPVGRTGIVQVVIIAKADHPASNLREFIAMAKRNPGKHSFAYYGDLGIPAMAAEAGIDILRVPYKGGAPALIDTASGIVDILASSLAQALPLIRAGKVKVLAVSSEERLADMPNVATVKEIVPGYKSIDYMGVFVPKATPRPVIDQLWQATSRVLANPDFQRAAGERGVLVRPMGPDQLNTAMEVEYANTRKTVRTAGILPE